MLEKEIFEHLFKLSNLSNDKNGVVCSCLVRNDNIVAEAVSMEGGVHAEYALLKILDSLNLKVQESDYVYTTVEPCGKRTSGGPGEVMGDCTTNLINAGVKHVIYAAQDPDAAVKSRNRFADAQCELKQTKDKDIIIKAIRLFNSTVSDSEDMLSEQ